MKLRLADWSKYVLVPRHQKPTLKNLDDIKVSQYQAKISTYTIEPNRDLNKVKQNKKELLGCFEMIGELVYKRIKWNKPCFFILILLVNVNLVKAQVWGANGSRTEVRDDAGLRGDAGAMSGFYQTSNPVNYPAGAQSWWHLLDVRHANPANNYTMQFAGSFFDQNLYFRKTNDNAAQPWSKIPLEDNLTVSFGSVATNYTPNQSNWTTDGSTLRLNALDYSTISFHDSNNRVDFIRAGGGTIQLGYDGGWGNANIGFTNGIWNSAGNVGIGTTSPDSKLSVKGTIHCQEVKVDMNGWADYVFKPDFKLSSLEDIKAYIEKSRHLPDMPTEEEVKKEGVNLGEMNIKLLKKVEELTLYLIEKDKEMKEANARLDAQQQLIIQQQKRLDKIENLCK